MATGTTVAAAGVRVGANVATGVGVGADVATGGVSAAAAVASVPGGRAVTSCVVAPSATGGRAVTDSDVAPPSAEPSETASAEGPSVWLTIWAPMAW